MLQPGTYRGTHANLTYTLTLRPTQDGQHEMLLTLPGRPPHVWGTLTPKNVATWDEADLRMLLHAELDAAADMLADGLAGWPVELPDALDMDMVPQWVFGQLNAARVDFATGWIPCPCGRVQSRFRRQSGTYTVQARSRPLDWDAIAHDVLTLVSRGPFSRAGNDALDDSDPVAALLARVRADPALHTLALEASSFELPARTLEEVFVQLNNEHSELHDHVHHGEDALRLMMLRHAGPVLGIDVPAPLLAALDDSSPEAEFLRSLPPDALAREFANLLLGHDDAWDDWNGDHMRMSVFLDTLHGPQSEPLPTLRRGTARLRHPARHAAVRDAVDVRPGRRPPAAKRPRRHGASTPAGPCVQHATRRAGRPGNPAGRRADVGHAASRRRGGGRAAPAGTAAGTAPAAPPRRASANPAADRGADPQLPGAVPE